MAVDRTPVNDKRQAFTQARATRLQAQADLATAQASVTGLSRTTAAEDAQLQAAQAQATQAAQAVAAAREAEKTAGADLHATLTTWLTADPESDVGRLEAIYPIVLLPVRVQTRFVPEASELRVRVYPDEIFADAHEPELSAAERDAGKAYWATTGADDLGAWQVLLQSYPSTRAAWIVRATEPGLAESASPGGTPAPVSGFDKPPGWSRAVQARLLPDRFVVIASRGSTTKRAVGTPVVEPLALTVGPDSLDTDQVQLDPDGNLVLDETVKWTVDFDTAVSVGMGIGLSVDADDLRLGFDRLLVVGVKTSLDAQYSAQQLGELFDAHHYTRGLAVVRQGSPTSNTLGTPAAYPPADDNAAQSFAVERGPALDAAKDCAGQTLSMTLGLPPGVFSHIAGADLNEVVPALKMNRALYTATLGYFLDQMMAPLIPPAAVNEIGQYFSQWVIPRGPASAFRIGRVPYGVLPVTSLARWQHADDASPVQKRLVELLQRLRPLWLSATTAVPHVGRSSDPDQDLLDVLAMDASTRQTRVRRVVGDTLWLNLALLFNWPVAQWENYHQQLGAQVLATAGIQATVPPRVLGMNFSRESKPYAGPLVDTAALSETALLGARDYISWVRTATVEQLHLEQLPTSMDAQIKRALLYRFLRHGALAEYHWWTGILLAAYSPAPVAPVGWRELELIGIVPNPENRQTPWQRFRNQVQLPNIGLIDLAAFFDGDYEAQLRTLTGVGDYRDALAVLAKLPTAELERLFTETLDAVSHRLDAWITSVATQRLSQSQAEFASRCFLGAYGWVENLKPETTQTQTLPDGRVLRSTPGGYIQAPSMTHAATAAVLRNAYLTHLGETQSPYGIDLSSAQVRVGRYVLDSVRNGQPVGAVFGYLLERALHDQHAESLIDPIRHVAPLVANKTEDSGQPPDTVAARNVVDGLTLRTKWKTNQLFNVPNGLPGTIAHRDILEQQLSRLDRAVDAVADLLLTESVHQIVRGSTMASGAGLDALAQGTRPPDPDIARAPTGGTTLTHRLAITLGPAIPPPGAGWPAAPTPRAACEPRLDAWVGSLLGDPRTATCRVDYLTTTGATRTVTVSFDQLQLRPLDVLPLATAVTTDPAASELDRRVLYAAFGDDPPADAPPADAPPADAPPADAAADSSFTIVYTADPAADRATTRTITELLDVANALSRVLGGMRPLLPVDLVPPEEASQATQQALPETPGAKTRAQAAVTALGQVQTNLQQAINAVPADTPPTATQATALRSPLRAAAAFGIAAAFPAFDAGTQEGGLDTLPLLDQARSVLTELTSRLAAATSPQPDELSRAIFGRDFCFLTGFSFPAPTAVGAELTQAIAYGPTLLGADPHAIDRWLTQVMRIREPLARWRMLRLLTETNGATPARWYVAQLPHQPGASWVALPPNPNEQRVSGTVSLLLHAPTGPPDPAQGWYGLFLDEWSEMIPNDREHAGITFRYDDTAGEAAQAILVAVPPTTGPSWDFDALVASVDETLDLAKIRAVDLESLDSLAQLIPTIFLAANAGDDTISTTIETVLDMLIRQAGAG